MKHSKKHNLSKWPLALLIENLAEIVENSWNDFGEKFYITDHKDRVHVATPEAMFAELRRRAGGQ